MPSHPDAVAADGGRVSPVSAWSPFRHRMFAAMWSAQFVSNIGSWMQTVAAQWLMLTGWPLGPLAGRFWRFRSIPPETLLPAGDWPAPVLAPDQTPEGPVLVSIQYRARPGLEDQLMTALQQMKNSRRRTGAISWRAWHDARDPGRVLEEFVVASWDEHLRQHERVTKREQAHLERVRELTDPDHPVTVTHWLAVNSRKQPGSPAKPS
jgi:Transmembrane secretion effector